jgi:hypothetical protein
MDKHYYPVVIPGSISDQLFPGSEINDIIHTKCFYVQARGGRLMTDLLSRNGKLSPHKCGKITNMNEVFSAL